MNGENYRLKRSKTRRQAKPAPTPDPEANPEIGKILPPQPNKFFAADMRRGPIGSLRITAIPSQQALFYAAPPAGFSSALGRSAAKPGQTSYPGFFFKFRPSRRGI